MRKTRSTTAKRKPAKKTAARTARRKNSNPALMFDIFGIAVIILGLITLVALFADESCGMLGRYIAATLHITVGMGAFIIPLLMVLAGIMLIVGPLKIAPRNISIGSLILFLVIITWASLAAGIDVDHPEHGGGYIGNGLAVGISYLTGQLMVGKLISYIVLAGLAVIGVVIIVNVPLASLIEKIETAYSDWKEAAEERMALAQDTRAERAEKVAKPKEEEVVKESRKRTLAKIFGDKEAIQEEVEEDKPLPAIVEPPKPPVQINTGSVLKPEKPAKILNLTSEPMEHGEFQLPPTTLLTEAPPPPPRVESELKGNIEIIERTLEEFKVAANVVEISCGPTVARYEIRLAPGIKVNKIVGLADNLAMQLAAIDVRVEAPIPGKAAIGVEVPNRNRGVVVMREILESKQFRESTSKLAFALGKDVAGRSQVGDITRMPHMLVGGATNAGKSVCLGTLIMSLLFRATPDELKMVLIDPKRVELSLFEGIPHLACPVVKDVKQAAGVLRAVVQEMEKRYDTFARVGARNLEGYNEKVQKQDKLPYMVVVVDELADMMMQCAAEVEGSITRLAQLARATGIHLVIATQRPSVDVITGIIKANISSRIAFAVSSHHDSRTILDQKGAERLIGRGDMLFLPIDASKPMRIQGCYVSEKEIEDVCTFLKDQRKPVYTIQPGQVPGSGGSSEGGDGSLADEFYEPSVRFVVNTGYCSTSMLQRKFKIGYTRAARIVDAMEENGIVGGLDGAKPRQVLVSKADLESMFGGHLGFPPDDVPVDDEFDEEVPPAEEIVFDSDDEEE